MMMAMYRAGTLDFLDILLLYNSEALPTMFELIC